MKKSTLVVLENGNENALKAPGTCCWAAYAVLM